MKCSHENCDEPAIVVYEGWSGTKPITVAFCTKHDREFGLDGELTVAKEKS